MAIQGVSFMGREGCIEPAIKKVANEAPSYIGHEPTGNVKKVATRVKEAVETVREADLKSYVDSHGIIEKVVVPADKMAEAYKAAHGIQ